MSGVPPSWAVAQMGWLCQLVNGRAFKPSDWTSEGLPIIRIQNLNNPSAPFNHYNGDFDKRFAVKNGDLLFAWSGTPGTSFGAHIWQGEDAILNQHIFNISFDESSIDKKFFQLAINQKLQDLISIAHGGVGLRHVTKGMFEGTEIALPPVTEQRRIVAKLDSLTDRTRRARDELDRIPTLIEHYKQAILQKAFSGELTADWRRLRLLPDPPAKVLSQLVAIPIRNGLSIRGTDGPPGFRSLRLSALRSRKVNMDDVRFLPIDAARADRYLLKEGDILISRGNGTKAYVGLASLVLAHKEPTIFPDTAFRLRLDSSKALPKWLLAIWNAPQVRSQVETIAKTTAGIWKISQGDIATVEIAVPTIEEQQEVIQRLEPALAWIEALASEYLKASSLLPALNHAVLSKAFRGDLVQQDPAN